MKAKIKTKKFVDNREKLQDIIPMDTPLCIFIEPTDKCNFKCRFCPHVYPDVIKNTKGRNHGNMDFNLYKKIIDDIKEFNNNVKQLVLYKDGEPLLHPQFPEMIEYAKKSNKFNNILTTTNAYLLNENIALKIIDAGLDRINISIEGINSKQYKEVANVDIDFRKVIKNVEYFYKHKQQCEVSVKIPGNFISEEDKKEFYNIFGDISDLIFVENLVFTWPNFDHNGIIFDPILTNIYDKVVNKVVCPQIFFSFAIGSNGDVLACCVDWERKLVIGNVNNSSVKEVWNSQDMYDLQVMFLEKKKNEHPYCSTCNAPSYGMLDNIDPYAEEILYK
ncbi:radical SAM protein, partial [Brachyspira hyodysenteriae]